MIGSLKSSLADWARLVRKDRDGSLYGSLLVVAACLGVLGLLLLSGCSASSGASVVDAPRAREALKTALDHWKSGGDPKELESSSTPMVAQDFEWAAGAKLLDYEVQGERPEGRNLRFEVKLKLGPQGNKKAAEKKGSYVVGTSPSLTVFRDVMRH